MTESLSERIPTALLLAWALFASVPARGDTAPSAGSTEAEGLAAIVKDDVAMARDKAIDDAKRKAVEQVAGAVVSAQTITENFQVVEDRILARASGFVRSYQILSEGREEGVYKVRIAALVDKNAVADDLSLIFRVKPRVIVMIAEQNVGAKDFSFWWGNTRFVTEMDIMQSTLIAEWQPKGFKFIDPSLLKKNKLRVQGALKDPAISNESALAIGRGADADVAIVGKVLVNDAGPVMEGVKMRSFHAVGSLRVLNIDTGEIIAVADETGVAPHIEPNMGGRAAIKALTQKLQADLAQKILAQWTAEEVSAREIELEVVGAPSKNHLDAFQRIVRDEVRGVESFALRRKAKGTLYYELRIRSRAVDFGEALERQDFPDFRVEVMKATKARLVLKLVGAKS